MNFVKPVVVLPFVTALALAGCTDMGPRQQTGALVGAAAGGLVGGVAGGNPGTAVVGAVIGGIAGGAIGQGLDAQAGELRGAFGDSRIGVVNTGSSLVVTMPQDILFATGSAALSGALRSDLAALAAHLNKYRKSTVQVVGHTDNVGEAGYNMNLSRERAQAVSSVLAANGVSSARLTAIGRGESQPIATNLTAEGRAKNRRVEIIIIPN